MRAHDDVTEAVTIVPISTRSYSTSRDGFLKKSYISKHSDASMAFQLQAKRGLQCNLFSMYIQQNANASHSYEFYYRIIYDFRIQLKHHMKVLYLIEYLSNKTLFETSFLARTQ